MVNKMLRNIKSNKMVENFVVGLLISQPILDIISFFVADSSLNIVTTLLRMLIFGVVTLYAFWISENKKPYFIMAGVLIVLFALHMLACISEGYVSIYEDVAMYIRTIQVPVYTLAFITFFRNTERLKEQIGKTFWVNYVIITASIILSFIVGKPEFTYTSGYGIKGWFYTGNAQSCIISVMAPLALVYAYRKKSNKLFFITILLEFANLYLFGTRVAYYSIFIVGLAFMIFLLWNRERQTKVYYITLVALIVCALGYKISPCYLQQYVANASYAEEEEEVNKILTENKDEEEPSEEQEIDIETYREIYNMHCKVLVDRFGLERVVEKYDYSVSVADLVSNRELKVNYGSLLMDEKNVLTRLFGFEYMGYVCEGEVFDPENDFPALYFSHGYVGLGLYIVFILYFVVIALKSIIIEKGKVSLEKGMLGTALVLMLGTAQLSGNVLRRPNVSIYLSVMLAYLFVICVSKRKNDVSK